MAAKKKPTRRRPRRKNPSMDYGMLGMGLLGAVAIAAGAYAVEGTNLSKPVKGAIEAGASIVIGGATMMVSKGLGVGIAAGGTAIGAKHLGEAALMSMSQPAASNGNGNGNTSAVRANLGRVNTVVQQLPARSRAGNVSDLFGAIRAAV